MLATVRIFTTAQKIRGAIFGAATSASSELSSSKHDYTDHLLGMDLTVVVRRRLVSVFLSSIVSSYFYFFTPQFCVIRTNFLSKVDFFFFPPLVTCALRNDLWVAVGLLSLFFKYSELIICWKNEHGGFGSVELRDFHGFSLSALSKKQFVIMSCSHIGGFS